MTVKINYTGCERKNCDRLSSSGSIPIIDCRLKKPCST